MFDKQQVISQAQIAELHQQQVFLGGRAASLAGEVAVLKAQLELANGRIAALETKLAAQTSSEEPQGKGAPGAR